MLFQYIVQIALVAIVGAQMEGYIVGGDKTNIKKYPHSVFLYINCNAPTVTPKISYICGASVINQILLLTAAHCIFDCTDNMKITATVGNEDRTKGSQRTASSIVTHGNFFSQSFSYDIGMIKLNKELRFSAKVKRVALMGNPPYRERAEIAGWGYTGEMSPTMNKIGSIILKRTDQWVWSYTKCDRFFRNYMEPKTLCASNDYPDNFASSGDSGSALLVRGYIQIGIMSFFVPSRGEHVGVYTDVGAFYNWITNTTKRMYCSP